MEDMIEDFLWKMKEFEEEILGEDEVGIEIELNGETDNG